MTVNDLLPVINQRVLNLKKGDKFTTKSLLADRWHQIDSPTKFGNDFRKAVNNGDIPNVTVIAIQTSGRKREYQRK